MYFFLMFCEKNMVKLITRMVGMAIVWRPGVKSGTFLMVKIVWGLPGVLWRENDTILIMVVSCNVFCCLRVDT